MTTQARTPQAPLPMAEDPGGSHASASPRPLFLIEINELCPTLIERWMAEGRLPGFARLFSESTIYTTDAGEEGLDLEPWIQWVSVHSGLTYAEHGVFHLGDGRRLEQSCVATELSEAGVQVGVFGSMNTNYGALDGYVIPDPWDGDGRPHPIWLTPFFQSVARQVKESSAEDADLSFGEKARLGWFLVRHGLSFSTVRAILSQLRAERRDPGVRWRRAMLLDRIQYDLFRHLNRRFGVRFATFFSNATAHFQHYFWRHMDPDAFDTPPPEDDPPSYENAIFEGYQANDRLLSRLLDDYPDAVLVLAGALSQQAWNETSKCTYRPRSFEALLAFAGIAPETATVLPVMAEQFHVTLPDDASATAAAERLEGLSSAGEQLLYVDRKGTSIFSGCRFESEAEAKDAVVARADGESAAFDDLFHRVHTMRSGRHHPDGILWIRGGAHEVVHDRVPLTRIAPTILEHFGVTAPAHMRAAPLTVALAGARA